MCLDRKKVEQSKEKVELGPVRESMEINTSPSEFEPELFLMQRISAGCRGPWSYDFCRD